MAQIVRCDICQVEVPPEKAHHSILRYWKMEPGGRIEELTYDLCERCHPLYIKEVEEVKAKVQRSRKEWEQW